MATVLHAHLTTNYLHESDLEGFMRVCHQLNCKPLLIMLPRGEHQQQAMATAYVQELHQAQAIAQHFGDRGYVIRRINLKRRWMKLNIILSASTLNGTAKLTRFLRKHSSHSVCRIRLICRATR